MAEKRMEMTETQFRNKIVWFSFVFSILVIWVHSYNAELFLGMTVQMERVFRVERFIGDGMGQIAVPGFFMISAYLFYRNFQWNQLTRKWNRRLVSVLIPFLIWNFLYYLGYAAASRAPWLGEVVGKGKIPFTIPAALDAALHYTYNYVFWYLHQLMLLILLAPVLYFAGKQAWSFWILWGTLWGMAAAGLDLPFVNLDALIYYFGAARLALLGQQGGMRPVERSFSRKRAMFGAMLLIVAMILNQIGGAFMMVPRTIGCRMFAVGGLWFLVPEEKLVPAAGWMQNNFFLYAVHFALVRFLNKAAARLFPDVIWQPLLIYLMMPILVVAVSTFLGNMLRRISPSLWKILNGFR